MYLFFVRHFNDIDHTVPIAWKMAEDGHPVGVYCINPLYDITSDYRLQFLKDRGVTVDNLYHAFDRDSDVLYCILRALVKKFGKLQIEFADHRRRQAGKLSHWFGKLNGRLRSVFYKVMRKLYYDENWAAAILQQTQAKVICFDHVMPKLYVVDAFLKAARRLSIPSIALPHGVYLYTNEATKPKATDERRLAKFNRFDAVIVTNELRKRLLVDAGVADGKILVLGSARYCDEWLTQNRRILPGVFTDRRQVSDNLKVVLMPSKPQCRMDVDKLFSTCRVLASLEGVEAMIKPHTRIRTQQQVFDNIPLPDVSEYLTAELCEWADVLINVGSSVITEALMQDKPALYLKYLHPNTTLFEELGACWTLQDEEDLKNAMSRLREDKRYMPYRKESVAQFIKEIVYGGSHDRDVLGRYTQFIINCGDERLPVDAKAVTTH